MFPSILLVVLGLLGLLLLVFYVVAAISLSLYGFNALILTGLYWRHRRQQRPLPLLRRIPRVTVQLPIFNEQYVVERLIDAVAEIDWPGDRLEIQVLDDSTDSTTELAESRVGYHRQRGLNIRLIHRTDRTGYKAGALAEGLKCADGEFIALFDADFMPTSDFLRRTVPYFLCDPHLGLVQTRWGHLNEEYSGLTRGQALGIDGHFVVEQTARNRSGLFINFNGTAGVWRRAAIDGAGGWHTDTLTEDLDLSYRAQLAGWRALYLPDVVVPAELPPQVLAFKNQQFRWAKGSVQTLLKLGGRLVKSPIPLAVRLEGLIHLGSYLGHPLLLLVLLMSVPMVTLHAPSLSWLASLSLASLGPPALYVTAQLAIHSNQPQRLLRFPLLMMLGTGTALSNSVAVFEALTGRNTSFVRTPKFRIEAAGDEWMGTSYALSFSPLALGELALAAYALAGALLALHVGNVWVAPFFVLYALGFGWVGVMSVVHSLPLLHRLVFRRSTRQSIAGLAAVWLAEHLARLAGSGK